MTIKEFEKKHLKPISPHLWVKPHPLEKDVAGVYFKDIFIQTVPPNDIYDEHKPNHTDAYGFPYRTIPFVMAKVNQAMEKMNDDDYLKLMTDKFNPNDHDSDDSGIIKP